MDDQNLDIDIYGDAHDDYGKPSDSNVDEAMQVDATAAPGPTGMPATGSTIVTDSPTGLTGVAGPATNEAKANIPRKPDIDPTATSAVVVSDLNWWSTDDDVYVEFFTPQAAATFKQHIHTMRNSASAPPTGKHFSVIFSNPHINPFRTRPKDGLSRNQKDGNNNHGSNTSNNSNNRMGVGSSYDRSNNQMGANNPQGPYNNYGNNSNNGWHNNNRVGFGGRGHHAQNNNFNRYNNNNNHGGSGGYSQGGYTGGYSNGRGGGGNMMGMNNVRGSRTGGGMNGLGRGGVGANNMGMGNIGGPIGGMGMGMGGPMNGAMGNMMGGPMPMMGGMQGFAQMNFSPTGFFGGGGGGAGPGNDGHQPDWASNPHGTKRARPE
ncbi:RRM domain-containing protein [Ceratocystis lukuohia]|uniref:RRM domain-containing protein n=1 Tax=Ceratocystis lukuohia TaxID=2019550 RepID=A0ABR4MG90_9PEZI